MKLVAFPTVVLLAGITNAAERLARRSWAVIIDHAYANNNPGGTRCSILLAN